MGDKRLVARRRFLQQALSGVALTSGLLPTLVHALGKVPELPPGRSIYKLRGRVRVDHQPASLDTHIKAGSLIETDADSEVVFVVGKDAHLLRADSRLQLEGSDLLETGLRLLTGKLLSVFGERKAGQSYQAQTDVVTIGIRGTAFYLEAEASRTYICTCYGKVELSANFDADSRETIVAHHHDAPRYIARHAPKGHYITSAPMKGHKDSELTLIEALVGRKPPFLKSPFYSLDDNY